MKTPEETFKEIMKRFDKEFTQSYAGDSGFGGNDPQDPAYDWACGPEDMKAFLKDSLVEFGESLIGQNQGYLEEDIQNDSEDVEKFNDLIDNRNGLRAEQRQELEKISK